jgi:hypothetical protein
MLPMLHTGRSGTDETLDTRDLTGWQGMNRGGEGCQSARLGIQGISSAAAQARDIGAEHLVGWFENATRRGGRSGSAGPRPIVAITTTAAESKENRIKDRTASSLIAHPHNSHRLAGPSADLTARGALMVPT